MGKLSFLFFFFCVLKGNAENYYLSFTGTGASNIVNTVKVENLTAGTSLLMNGSDVLSLTIITGVNSIENRKTSELNIYPNPMINNSILQICPPVEGEATITVFDFTGKLVSQIQDYLGNNLQEFRLSGLNRGIYFISIKSNSYIFSAKLICETKSAGTINIEKISNNHAIDQRFLKIETKGTRTPIDMAYTTGDRLKFTGISGNYSTILVDIPTTNKTITFNFIACFDGDNINYPVVSIGTQIWMAENLKTTKYNDGTVIPNITDDATWAAYSSGAYCDYNDTPANSITYGRLYNWFVVDNNPATNVASNGGKNVCPIGWHIPSDPEWSNLTTFLGGESVAGGKLKETGTIHWISPNNSATNETGFTALPGGYRNIIGQDFEIGFKSWWWSSTENNGNGQSWWREVFNNYAGVYRGVSGGNRDGKSVRCIRD